MLWDYGTWKPETEDVDAALKKGDLKFTLDGYKLKGSWVLVAHAAARRSAEATDGAGCSSSTATIGRGAGHREFAPRSVKSDGEFEDILAADNPDVWTSNKPAKGGDAGKMLASIIRRAAEIKAKRSARRFSRAEARAERLRPAGTQGALNVHAHEISRRDSTVQTAYASRSRW